MPQEKLASQKSDEYRRANTGCRPLSWKPMQETWRFRSRGFGKPGFQQSSWTIRSRQLQIHRPAMKRNEICDRTLESSQPGAAQPACSQVCARFLLLSSRCLAIDDQQDIVVR